MKFLIIDDDKDKIECLTKYFDKGDSYTHKKSRNSGLRELFLNDEQHYDCLILDMNFPIYDNESVESEEGLDVLSELERKDCNIPVVIFSSGFTNVSGYPNVKDYIMFNGNCLKEKVKAIKEMLKRE